MPIYVPAGAGRRRRRALWSGGDAAVYNSQSAAFDGVDDYISATKPGLGASGSSYTAHCFVNVVAFPGSGNRWIFGETYDPGQTVKIPWSLYINTASKFGFDAYDGTNEPNGNESGTSTTATWYQVCLIRDHASLNFVLYKNRTSVLTVAYTNADFSVPVGSLVIGAFNSGTQWANVIMKDCKVFDVALNDTNIALLTVANIGLKPSQIAGWDTANAADANLKRLYGFQSPWSNTTVTTANQVKDTGADAAHATGFNLAGSADSGVSTNVPA